MRGGTTWDAAWLRRPDVCGIVTGTVDQVGSRLFFRGYGVSSRRRPLDAALVGTDSLIFVDEAHLAVAMSKSVETAIGLDRPEVAAPVAPATMVQMSATAGAAGDRDDRRWTYRFDASSHAAETEPLAHRRLHAGKTLSAVTASRTSIVRDMVDAARKLATKADDRVLVVCNTVDRARMVRQQLVKDLGDAGVVSLLTGRTRPLDRERVVDRDVAPFIAGKQQPSEHPRILVSTQTVEVGIDLDATAMVTESASWDALVQRIGRVNRRGDLSGAANVVVMHDGVASGPVYGESRDITWNFLSHECDDASLDVSAAALRELSPRVPDGASRRPIATPVLLAPHLDAWARTNPAPSNDPPLAGYLHGLDSSPAGVSLAWRDGLLDWEGSNVGPELAGRIVEAVPIRGGECVEVPLGAVRRWLAGDDAEAVSDIEGVDVDFELSGGSEIQALRRGQETDGSPLWQWVTAREVRPGDQLVVPSARGGLDEFGWAPNSPVKVRDLAEAAALAAGAPVLRLDPEMPERLGIEELDDTFWDHLRTIENSDDRQTVQQAQRSVLAQVLQALTATDAINSSLWARSELEALATALERGENPRDDSRVVMAAGRVRGTRRDLPDPPFVVLRGERTAASSWLDADEARPDGTVHAGRRVSLHDHQGAVADRAEQIALAIGIAGPLQRSIVDAAAWHDAGKVDPRFQTMLFGGDEVRAVLADEPVAKSGMNPGDAEARLRALKRSGLPRGARHEAWSAALVGAHLAGLRAPYDGDPDLVLHLIASHHGHARPLLPPVVETADHRLEGMIDETSVAAELPRLVDLDDADRFRRLNLRYGRWGLALLEAVVRSADMTVSSEGS